MISAFCRSLIAVGSGRQRKGRAMSDDDEMEEIRRQVAELGLSVQLAEYEKTDRVGEELAEGLANHNLSPTLMLYAAMNLVAHVLHRFDEEDRTAACEEARADLDDIIKVALSPDSVFEARARRSKFRVVPPADKS
jgi:hypothetical protein